MVVTEVKSEEFAYGSSKISMEQSLAGLLDGWEDDPVFKKKALQELQSGSLSKDTHKMFKSIVENYTPDSEESAKWKKEAIQHLDAYGKNFASSKYDFDFSDSDSADFALSDIDLIALVRGKCGGVCAETFEQLLNTEQIPRGGGAQLEMARKAIKGHAPKLEAAIDKYLKDGDDLVVEKVLRSHQFADFTSPYRPSTNIFDEKFDKRVHELYQEGKTREEIIKILSNEFGMGTKDLEYGLMSAADFAGGNMTVEEKSVEFAVSDDGREGPKVIVDHYQGWKSAKTPAEKLEHEKKLREAVKYYGPEFSHFLPENHAYGIPRSDARGEFAGSSYGIQLEGLKGEKHSLKDLYKMHEDIVEELHITSMKDPKYDKLILRRDAIEDQIALQGGQNGYGLNFSADSVEFAGKSGIKKVIYFQCEDRTVWDTKEDAEEHAKQLAEKSSYGSGSMNEPIHYGVQFSGPESVEFAGSPQSREIEIKHMENILSSLPKGSPEYATLARHLDCAKKEQADQIAKQGVHTTEGHDAAAAPTPATAVSPSASVPAAAHGDTVNHAAAQPVLGPIEAEDTAPLMTPASGAPGAESAIKVAEPTQDEAGHFATPNKPKVNKLQMIREHISKTTNAKKKADLQKKLQSAMSKASAHMASESFCDSADMAYDAAFAEEFAGEPDLKDLLTPAAPPVETATSVEPKSEPVAKPESAANPVTKDNLKKAIAQTFASNDNPNASNYMDSISKFL